MHSEWLEEHGFRAEKSYNTANIHIFREGEHVIDLEGSKLAELKTPEDTLEYIKEVLKPYV